MNAANALVRSLDDALASDHVDDIELDMIRDLIRTLDLSRVDSSEQVGRVAGRLTRRVGLSADAVDCLRKACMSAWALAQSLRLRDATEPKCALSVASLRLTSWALRFLPVADRAEYEELFHSELLDLKCGWWGQVRYSLRVLAHAPLLRHELRLVPPALRERA
ncbi:MAG TPA: hypothetical protein VFX16_10815 [Pseudonocardiaceae bacterium]|nr:hypothetical protein [Pseudonocardiaceae bacterium]